MNSAVISLILLALVFIGSIFEILPMWIINLGACCLMVILCGIKTSTAFSPFAEDSVLLMSGMMVLCMALSDNGTMALLGNGLKRIFGRHTELMILSFYAGLFVLSAFINNSSAVLCFLPFFLELIIEAGDRSRFYEQKYVHAVSMVAHSGGLLTVMGSSVNMASSGQLEAYGYEGLSHFALAPYGVAFFVSSILYIYLYGNRVTKKMRDRNPRSELVLEYEANYEKKDTVITRKMMISLFLLIATALSLAFSKKLGVSRGTIGISSALLCIITGCLDSKECLKKMKWKTILMLGGALGVSKCLVEAGGTDILATVPLKLFGSSLTPMGLLAFFTLCALVITQFVSNVGTSTILIPIVIPIAAAMGLRPIGFVAAITAAASCSFLTPLASYLEAMLMDWGSYRFRDYFTYGWLAAIIDFILILILTPIFFPFT